MPSARRASTYEPHRVGLSIISRSSISTAVLRTRRGPPEFGNATGCLGYDQGQTVGGKMGETYTVVQARLARTERRRVPYVRPDDRDDSKACVAARINRAKG